MKLHSKLQKILLQAGLSELETCVYLELLKNPAQTKWEMVNRTQLSKSSVYRAFEKLQNLKMIKKTKQGYKANSLKGLVSDLKFNKFKKGKLIYQIQQISPYLHMPNESIEEIETLFTTEQIADSYLFMAARPYSFNLDFGDFENFISKIGGLPLACKFRNIRSKKSKNFSLCTTPGPSTSYFRTREQEKHFNGKLKLIDIDYKGSFIIFSDTDDYVLFNNFQNPENQSSVLVKSRVLADIQRNFFDLYSQRFGN